ncbi:MAG: class I SAM-dependent methyltransferase [Phycisphaerae bacterium]
MNSFNAKRYWEQRLQNEFNLHGVGRRNWGIHFNRWAYRVRRRVFMHHVRSLKLDMSALDCLDVGSGTGFYLDRWLELNARSVTGADLTDAAVNRLRQRYTHLRICNLDIGGGQGELAESQFHAVSCMDVLFHIVDDDRYRQAVRNIFSLIRPGGWFIFSEAFLKGPEQRMEHIVHRSARQIQDDLHAAGFELVGHHPFLVLMNDPVEQGHPLLKAVWRGLKGTVQRANWTGAVVGPALYPLELALVRGLNKSPSTQIILCRRPANRADADQARTDRSPIESL